MWIFQVEFLQAGAETQKAKAESLSAGDERDAHQAIGGWARCGDREPYDK